MALKPPATRASSMGGSRSCVRLPSSVVRCTCIYTEDRAGPQCPCPRLGGRERNISAQAALRAIGPPPFANRDAVKVLRQWADVLAHGEGDPVQPRPTPIAPDYSRDEVPGLMRGAEFSRRELYDELETVDLRSLGLTFEVPFSLFHGTCDQATPIDLAEELLRGYQRAAQGVRAIRRLPSLRRYQPGPMTFSGSLWRE